MRTLQPAPTSLGTAWEHIVHSGHTMHLGHVLLSFELLEALHEHLVSSNQTLGEAVLKSPTSAARKTASPKPPSHH